ncbi:MAG: DUF2029 domain-containing protein [Rhodospirillales bacterium]|nr:DUF2029 domain-containing protein [Rhodospirillales bacterium]
MDWLRDRWHPGHGKTRLLTLLVALPMAGLALVIAAAIIGSLLGPIAPAARTLYLYWSWSAFLHHNAPAGIYDPMVLKHFEDLNIRADPLPLPFAYPPSMLLLIFPLAAASPAIGTSIWLGLSLAALIWASAEPARRVATAGFAAIAPATLATLYYGQVTLLVAACLIGGWRLVERRPVVAGVLFGLATVKPQFGLLVPVALVSGGYWRCAASATATVVASVLASGFLFGWSVWTGLPQAIAALSNYAVHLPGFDGISPTVAATARVLGAGPMLADILQALAALGAAVAVWIAFRGGATRRAVALLMAATYLATPYAVFYDLPMLTYAAALIVADRRDSGAGLGVGELAILILAVALPLLARFHPWGLPWGLAGVIAMVLLALRTPRPA